MAKVVIASESSAEIARVAETVNVPSGGSPSDEADQSPQPPVGHSEKKTLEDLVVGAKADKPWQYSKYSADNALWQGAALRR